MKAIGLLTTEEFREHVAKLCGFGPAGTGKRSHSCLVRQPTDRGYYPPAKKSSNKKGKKR